MEKTPQGTSVGVDDPYAHVERCDHCTDRGKCRLAAERPAVDREFARERREDDLRCPPADPASDREWADCPHFRSREHDRECARCGLEERRMAHGDERPLLEEHHLEYRDSEPRSGPERSSGESEARGDRAPRDERAGDAREPSDPRDDDRRDLAHDVTVVLCRWCHAKVHGSWARVDDDANPDPEALAEAEGRRSREHEELRFDSAAERYDRDGD